MAQPRPRTHFLVALIATFIDALKREFFVAYGGGSVTGSSAADGTGASGATAPAFTGTAPTTCVGADLATGTGFATAGQVVTTSDNQTLTLNQLAGCWLITATHAPCLIVSHPACTGAPAAFTVYGAPPATTAEGYRVLRPPTPVGTVASHTHTGPSHTHGAGTLAAGPVTAPIHFDRAEYSVAAANAANLATSLVLAKDVLTVHVRHLSDELAHLAVDTVNLDGDTVAGLPAALAAIVDLATAITSANAVKAAYNAHRSASGVHAADDSGHAIAASDATDQSSLNTLLNELKADINLHLASGLSTPSWRVAGA